MSLTSRIQALTAYANEVTGESDTTLSDAVATLAEGYGSSGGQGGGQVIASGTFVGAGEAYQNKELFVGNKMARQNFKLVISVPNHESISYDTDYKIIYVSADSGGVVYDLSANEDNCPSTPYLNLSVDNAGTITNVQVKGNWYIAYVRNTTLSFQMQGNTGWNRIKRNASGFYFILTNMPNRIFINGQTYNWELIYYGDDPNNDIVTV